jgi:5-formyltetrahydrofolate cyclo-ligase
VLHITFHLNNINNNMLSDSKTDDNTQRQQKQVLRKKIRSRLRLAYPSPSLASSFSRDVEDNDQYNAAATAIQMKLTSQSNQVFHQLFNLPQYQSSSNIGFFLSMPYSEIQTRDAISQMICKDGKTLYVPRVGLDFECCDMDLIRCEISDDGKTQTTTSATNYELFYDHWPKNKWGIPEPPSNNTKVATPGDIDLLIVPGLAFDFNRHRLGHGKGYYDRFIAKIRQEVAGGDDDDDDATTKKKPLLVGVCLEEQFLENESIPVSDHDFTMDMVLTPSKRV